MTPDFKKLREQAGLTLEELASLTDYSTAAINGLELRDEGGKRLRKVVQEVLESRISSRQAESSQSVKSFTASEWQLVLDVLTDELLLGLAQGIASLMLHDERSKQQKYMDALEVINQHIKKRRAKPGWISESEAAELAAEAQDIEDEAAGGIETKPGLPPSEPSNRPPVRPAVRGKTEAGE